MSASIERVQEVEKQLENLRKRILTLEERFGSSVKPSGSLPTKTGRSEKLTNILLAAFTGLLVLTSALQWWATLAGIKDTHTSFQTGTRAWITVKQTDIRVTEPAGPGGLLMSEQLGLRNTATPFLLVMLVNSGKSPALETETTIKIDVRETQVPKDYVLGDAPPEGTKSQQVVGQDGLISIGLPAGLTAGMREALLAGRHVLVIVGRTTYTDIFKDHHETKFCYFYNASIDHMSPCEHFNSVD